MIKQELSASFGEDYLCTSSVIFPQIQIHPHAQRAAQAAEAACVQGQFWSMNDTLFIINKSWRTVILKYANDLGLDIPQFLKVAKQVRSIASMKISKVDARVE